jgi:hypothetical protein
MAANTLPIFSKAGLIGIANILSTSTVLASSNGASATGVTGTGPFFLLVTADATNGSYLDRVRLRWVASTPTATTAVMVRLYTSTVSSGATTSANTDCIEELAMGVQNAANASTTTFPYDIPLKFVLPAGKTLLASVHQAPAASTEIQIVVFGGNY